MYMEKCKMVYFLLNTAAVINTDFSKEVTDIKIDIIGLLL
jgi:hypothetical protein